jgi:hypothetical protein
VEGVGATGVEVEGGVSEREAGGGSAPVRSKAAPTPAMKLRTGISIQALPTEGPSILFVSTLLSVVCQRNLGHAENRAGRLGQFGLIS